MADVKIMASQEWVANWGFSPGSPSTMRPCLLNASQPRNPATATENHRYNHPKLPDKNPSTPSRSC